MSIIETLITDRTASDAASWTALKEKGLSGMTAEELAEWLGGMKGSYNATDMNRVGVAVRYIAARMGETGYRLDVSPQTDWSVGDIPTAADLSAYLDQLDVLRGKLNEVLAAYQTESQYELPPTPPDMEGLTFQEANDIEKILKAVHDQLQYMGDHFYWVCSGDVYAGEV